MTVRELIAELRELPPEADVYVHTEASPAVIEAFFDDNDKVVLLRVDDEVLE